MAAGIVQMKGGEEAFRIRARRVSKGVRLDIKVHQAIEDLISDWCDGGDALRSLSYWGDGWSAAEPETDLKVRDLRIPTLYPITQIGEGLNCAPTRQGQYLANLAWLRIVGVSQGISIVVQGVFSLEEIQKWLKTVREDFDRIFQKELASFDIELQALVKER